MQWFWYDFAAAGYPSGGYADREDCKQGWDGVPVGEHVAMYAIPDSRRRTAAIGHLSDVRVGARKAWRGTRKPHDDDATRRSAPIRVAAVSHA